MGMGGWIISVAIIAAGIVGLFLALGPYPYHIFRYLGPLLIALGVTVGAISSGLRNPIAIVVIFVGIEGTMYVVNFYHLFGVTLI